MRRQPEGQWLESPRSTASLDKLRNSYGAEWRWPAGYQHPPTKLPASQWPIGREGPLLTECSGRLSRHLSTDTWMKLRKGDYCPGSFLGPTRDTNLTATPAKRRAPSPQIMSSTGTSPLSSSCISPLVYMRGSTGFVQVPASRHQLEARPFRDGSAWRGTCVSWRPRHATPHLGLEPFSITE